MEGNKFIIYVYIGGFCEDERQLTAVRRIVRVRDGLKGREPRGRPM